jgi:hypothetical protein
MLQEYFLDLPLLVLVLQASQPRSTAAFFRWREAGIRANFKRQLQDILQSISSEDVSIQQLQHELGIARAR